MVLPAELRDLRNFATFLSEQDPTPGSLRELTPGCWAAWRLGRTNYNGSRKIAAIKAMISGDGRLTAAMQRALQHRGDTPKSEEQAYTSDEFNAIKTTAARIFRAALHRIRQNRRHLEQWRAGTFDPQSSDAVLGEALDVLSRTGDVPTYLDVRGRRKVIYRFAKALGGDSSDHTWQRLFLSSEEATSLAALLIGSYGWNATSVYELNVPTVRADDGRDDHPVYSIELEKRRRHQPHRYERVNLADWGPGSPGKLITQALEATEPARQALKEVGSPTERLLIWHHAKALEVDDPAKRFGSGDMANLVGRWARDHRLPLQFRRLRKTATAQHRRTPTQHSRDTHDSVYVLPDPRTRERAAPVIAAGIADAVDHARRTLTARIGTGAEDGLETATARCTDNTHSPFSDAGSPCRASFLSCLACTNAVIAPAHLPRLAYLHHALDALRGVVSAPVWEHDWRAHFERLDDLRGHFSDIEWSEAAAAAAADDRHLMDRLLNRGLDT